MGILTSRQLVERIGKEYSSPKAKITQMLKQGQIYCTLLRKGMQGGDNFVGDGNSAARYSHTRRRDRFQHGRVRHRSDVRRQ